MSIDLTDTIAARASAPGPSERGIIRLTGEHVVQTVARHFESANAQPMRSTGRARRYQGRLRVDAIGDSLPADVLLWPTARSYTGQPMAELHTIGSPPLIEAILAQLFEDGVRPARNGEFTLRAFLSGRIDLVQAEAVLGVIDSTDQEQMERALRQLGGGVSGKLAATRAELISILGDLEAGLDFVEEDIEFIPADVMVQRLGTAIERLEALASSSEARMDSQASFVVALAGLPNAGKSTLFNALAESQLAIVSDVAGTTTDYLTVDIECDGVPVKLVDTAGEEIAGSAIMEIAQQQQGEQIGEARLVVWCSAADQSAEQREADERRKTELLGARGATVLFVNTKTDLAAGTIFRDESVGISATTGSGLVELTDAIASRLSETGDSELIGSTGARCHELLGSAIRSIGSARDAAVGQLGDELIAIELRDALESVGQIMGTVYTDDILDHIFSNFCIGK